MRLIIGLVAAICSTALAGSVLSGFWDWFVVPVFGGPSITVTQAIGLLFVASMFTIPIATTVGLNSKAWFTRLEDETQAVVVPFVSAATYLLSFLLAVLFRAVMA